MDIKESKHYASAQEAAQRLCLERDFGRGFIVGYVYAREHPHCPLPVQEVEELTGIMGAGDYE